MYTVNNNALFVSVEATGALNNALWMELMKAAEEAAYRGAWREARQHLFLALEEGEKFGTDDVRVFLACSFILFTSASGKKEPEDMRAFQKLLDLVPLFYVEGHHDSLPQMHDVAKDFVRAGKLAEAKQILELLTPLVISLDAEQLCVSMFETYAELFEQLKDVKRAHIARRVSREILKHGVEFFEAEMNVDISVLEFNRAWEPYLGLFLF